MIVLYDGLECVMIVLYDGLECVMIVLITEWSVL
jgi:hypothetical protein